MGKIYKISIIAVVVVFLIACKAKKSNNEPIHLDSIADKLIVNLDNELISKKTFWLDSVFQRLHKRNGFVGSVLYAERGQLIYKNAFGYGDIRKKENLSTESSFQLASVSKMFTSMAIMIMKERGQLEYDIDIRKYLPEFPYENVSIRLLLSHRAGLSRYMSLAHDQWKNKQVPISNDDMMDLFVKHKPATYFRPNNGFHYCNTNYALLANIIERVSGKSFNIFVKENIFDPLEMNNSFVYQMNGKSSVPPYITEGVPGYRYKGWRPIRQRNEYLNGVMGDKGVYSSVEDMFKFDQALSQNTLVSDTTLAEAFSPASPKSRKRKNNYGFGWRIRGGMDSTVYHYGWWKGFRAFYIRDMKKQKTIIVLSNRAKGVGATPLWKIIRSEKYELPEVSILADTIR